MVVFSWGFCGWRYSGLGLGFDFVNLLAGIHGTPWIEYIVDEK